MMDATPADLWPHPDRVSEAFADARIAEHIERYASERPRAGLQNVNEGMRRAGVPPAFRMHYIAAVALLGRTAEASLPERREHALAGAPRSEGWRPGFGPAAGP